MTDETPKRGRKPSPVTAAVRKFETASNKVRKLEAHRAKWEVKISNLSQQLGDFDNDLGVARQELEQARKELEEVLSGGTA